MTEEELENSIEPSTTDPSIEGKTFGVYNEDRFNFYDGKIKGALNQSIQGNVNEMETGYQVIRNKNQEEKTETAVLEKVNILELQHDDNTKQFASLRELEKELNKLNESIQQETTDKIECTIKVLTNFSIGADETIMIPQKLIVKLDLNGFTITSASISTITNNGELTLIDSSDASETGVKLGNITNGFSGTSDNPNKVIHNQENAKFIIESGTIKTSGSYTHCIYNGDKATVEIKGGTLTTTGGSGYGVYNCTDGNLKMSEGTINTSGTNAYGIYNCSQNDTELTGGTLTSSASHGIYTNNTGTTTITNFTITINNSANGIYSNNQGTIIIDSGTSITTRGKGVYNQGTGTIIVNNGILKSQSQSIYNYKTGTIEIHGGTLENTGSSNDSYGVYNYDGGTVNITGGTITSYQAGIYNNNYFNEGHINIENGTIKSKGSYGVYNDRSNRTGFINITGGSITSDVTYGVYNRFGELTIGKKIGEDVSEEGAQENTQETTGQEPDTDNPVIKGATYGVYNCGTFNYYDGKIIGASGKSINANITDKEPEYQIEKTIDETTQTETAILKKIDIVQIGDKSYSTIKDIQDAIDSLQDNKQHTIKVIKDMYISESDIITIPQNMEIILDLNGHVIETTSKSSFVNEGKLEIVDESASESEEKNGRIVGTAEVMIDNKGELTINSGLYNSIKFGERYDSDNKNIKIINNTGKLIWQNAKMRLDGGLNYGIYNTEEGTVDWESGDIYASQTSNVQYAIYTNSSNDINWKSGQIFLDTVISSTDQIGFYIGGTGGLCIETITFNNIGINTPASYSRNYSRQYLIYSPSNNKNAKRKVTIKNLVRETTDKSNDGYVWGINGYYVDLTIENGDFHDFSRGADINLYNSQMNIKNGTFNDEISINTSTSTSIIEGGKFDKVTNYNGDMTINNGTIRYLYISGNSTNVTMNNGKIYNENEEAVQIINSATFTYLGGTIESTKGYGVYIYNGTFTMGDNTDENVSTQEPTVKGSTYGVYKNAGAFNFYDGIIQGNPKAFYGDIDSMPEKYKVQYSDGECIAILAIISEVENMVSVGNMHFDSMQSAIEHAVSGTDDIVIHKNISITETLTIPDNANITINLNGHNLKGEISESLIINNGNLTIIDKPVEEDIGDSEVVLESKIENTTGYAITNKGTLTLGTHDSTVDSTTPNIIGTPHAIQNEGTVNWYDGKINNQTTTEEKQFTSETSVIARKIKENAENIITATQNAIQAIVQEPRIEVDKEFPIWTKDSVTATMYTTDRIKLDIVNENENVELRSITVKKEWEMSDEEAENYKAIIQLMKIENGKKVPVEDREGNTYTVEIIGNRSKKFTEVPVSKGGKVIEYALEEIAIKHRVTPEKDEWEDVPLEQFNVTYKNNK